MKLVLVMKKRKSTNKQVNKMKIKILIKEEEKVQETKKKTNPIDKQRFKR